MLFDFNADTSGQPTVSSAQTLDSDLIKEIASVCDHDMLLPMAMNREKS
jgi:hypothetical protein